MLRPTGLTVPVSIYDTRYPGISSSTDTSENHFYTIVKNILTEFYGKLVENIPSARNREVIASSIMPILLACRKVKHLFDSAPRAYLRGEGVVEIVSIDQLETEIEAIISFGAYNNIRIVQKSSSELEMYAKATLLVEPEDFSLELDKDVEEVN
jgi:hypothetical protein